MNLDSGSSLQEILGSKLLSSNPTTFDSLRRRPNFALRRPIHPCCDYLPSRLPTIPNVGSAPIHLPGFAYRRRGSVTKSCRKSDLGSSSVYPVGHWPGCLDAVADSSTYPVAPWPDYSGVVVRNSACPPGWCSHPSSLHSRWISANRNPCFGTHSHRVPRTYRHSNSCPRTYFHTRSMLHNLFRPATLGPTPLFHSPSNNVV
jgi:hypothetical protein